MSLVLGTVQFGRDYGISNETGKCTPEEVIRILDIASDGGVEMLETAPGYGDAEMVLGAAMPGHFTHDIITKVDRLSAAASRDPNFSVERSVRDNFDRSLMRLGRSSLHGLIVHQCEDLLGPYGDRLYAVLQSLKSEGRVRKIGVSIYDGLEIDDLLERYSLDFVQVPVNVFDQRLVLSGHLEKLKSANIEVYGRSIFLQGLLVMAPIRLPSCLEQFRPHILEYRRALANRGVAPVDAAVTCAGSLPQIDHLVVGVSSSDNLVEVLNAYANRFQLDFDFSPFHLNDKNLVDPRKWVL